MRRATFTFCGAGELPAPTGVPDLRRYPARDGEQLAYRIYDSTSDRILIFIHGSSYQGGGYHALAAFLSSGVAKVVLPNLRGHYMSGRRRGDVDYIGQYEDDTDDLIKFLRGQGLNGPITLGDHSSGGGFTIRFAGGAHAPDVSSYLPLAPIIPLSPSIKDGGTAGGWAVLHLTRIYGLIALNAVGIHGFNALPVIAFTKPVQFWNGTETLSYSYRLNASYLPRYNYHADIRALGARTLVLIGADDESIDAAALRALIAADARKARMNILPSIDHFGIFSDPAALTVIADWMRGLPERQ